MIGGICAFLNETALPDPPPTLASHQRRGLLFQKFCELASLCLSADESVHVDLVPEKDGSNWAPNRHIVNLVPGLFRIFQAPNPHSVDLVPEVLGLPSQMRDGTEDGIERGVKMPSEIFC